MRWLSSRMDGTYDVSGGGKAAGLDPPAARSWSGGYQEHD